ncbi:Receptor-type tyrosine-protein phosphatase S [Liparis tanakae]|uniref:protein-tyrosine-phosphatase n=1 Tax=Liparis tanakae TaxID=230148 RepID=A0A4Z2GCI8_9TELE|nr:Receptor-type tyrosine-protein phosphatase S [Liparis tanakae]
MCSSAGVGRTGVFITLSIVLERMRYEGVVDIFQTVKMLRTQRPAMVQTEDEYQFCYHAALEYLGSFDHYATLRKTSRGRSPPREEKIKGQALPPGVAVEDVVNTRGRFSSQHLGDLQRIRHAEASW